MKYRALLTAILCVLVVSSSALGQPFKTREQELRERQAKLAELKSKTSTGESLTDFQRYAPLLTMSAEIDDPQRRRLVAMDEDQLAKIEDHEIEVALRLMKVVDLAQLAGLRTSAGVGVPAELQEKLRAAPHIAALIEDIENDQDEPGDQAKSNEERQRDRDRKRYGKLAEFTQSVMKTAATGDEDELVEAALQGLTLHLNHSKNVRDGFAIAMAARSIHLSMWHALESKYAGSAGAPAAAPVVSLKTKENPGVNQSPWLVAENESSTELHHVTLRVVSRCAVQMPDALAEHFVYLETWKPNSAVVLPTLLTTSLKGEKKSLPAREAFEVSLWCDELTQSPVRYDLPKQSPQKVEIPGSRGGPTGAPAYQIVYRLKARTASSASSSTAPAESPAAPSPAPTELSSDPILNVVYGDARFGDRQTLDLHFPQQRTAAVPLVVWIHGGGWQSGSKENPPIDMLIDRGFAVAAINYRLTTEAPHPAQIRDCRDAIAWLRKNAKRYRLDPSRFGVWGSSAGGHLASLVGAVSKRSPANAAAGGAKIHSPSDVQAVCSWFGPTDLANAVADADPAKTEWTRGVLESFMGGNLDARPEQLKNASPLHHVDGDEPPFLIMHGDIDPLVPLVQSRRLADALRERGGDATLRVIPGAVHSLREHPACLMEVADFFERTLMPAARANDSAPTPVDLLAGIQVDRDLRRGIWNLRNDDGVFLRGYAIVGEPDFILALPWQPPREYRLTSTVKRVKNGSGAFGVGLASDENQFTVIFDVSSEDRFVSGIGHTIDGIPLVRRAEAHTGKVFEDGVWHRVAIDVRQTGVMVHLDGQLIYEWHGELSKLSRYPNQPTAALQLGGLFPGDFLVASCTLEPFGDDAGKPAGGQPAE